MNQLINPATLKALRETKRLTQEVLVELVNRIGKGSLDKRQLQRIEGKARLEGPHYVREKTLLALARALGVAPAELQSAREDSPAAPAEVDERMPLPVKVRPATVTKLDLIRSAYMVTLEEIIDLAPLMFVYHAESSLRERRQRLASDWQLRARFMRALPEMQHLIEEGEQATLSKLQAESDSIRYCDIFGTWLDHEVSDDDEFGDNLFTEYLQRLSGHFAAPSKLEVDEELPAVLVPHAENRITDYTVCTEYLDWLTGRDPEIKTAILNRELLIDNIPAKLRVRRDIPLDILAQDFSDGEAGQVACMRRELQQQRAAKGSNSGHGGQSKPQQSVE